MLRPLYEILRDKIMPNLDSTSTKSFGLQCTCEHKQTCLVFLATVRPRKLEQSSDIWSSGDANLQREKNPTLVKQLRFSPLLPVDSDAFQMI